MKQKTIYVGGGFIEQQYPYVLPIIFKYCEVNNIKRIIFEVIPSSKFFKNDYFKKNLNKFKIIEQKKAIPFFFRNKYIRFSIVFFKAFFYALKIERIKILKKKSFFEREFDHAVWDTCLNNSENYIRPNIFVKIVSSVKTYEISFLAKFLRFCLSFSIILFIINWS